MTQLHGQTPVNTYTYSIHTQMQRQTPRPTYTIRTKTPGPDSGSFLHVMKSASAKGAEAFFAWVGAFIALHSTILCFSRFFKGT